MNFARYKGLAREGPCEFIPGKIYFADNRISGDAVDTESFRIEDECGNIRAIKAHSTDWEFLPEVYAVIVNEFEVGEVGEVVVLDDLDDEGSLKVSIKGYGLREPSDVTILDKTTLYPGIMVMNESTGIWERVERTDESLWLATNPDMEMVSPEGYRFAVSNGEIAVVPMLTCINDIGTYGSLVEGHHYIPIKTVTINGMTTGYELIDENRTVMEYAHWRFRVV